MAAPQKRPPTLADADDDLEDLDDVLDQFGPSQKESQTQSAAKSLVSPPPPPPTATATTTFTRPRNNTRVDAPPRSIPGTGRMEELGEADEGALSAEFSKELMKGMENLMREIAGGALPGERKEGGGDSSDQNDKGAEEAFKAAWEKMLVEEMDGLSKTLADLEEYPGASSQAPKAASSSAATGASGSESKRKDNDFQNKIKQAMGKLKESESNLQAGSSKSQSGVGDADLERLLASLNDLGLKDGDVPEDETELANLLENMMGRLMSKDVLYEPLKELADSFPGYLANPPSPLSATDKERYEAQHVCVQKIITVFEHERYSDADVESLKKISDLMTELQNHGTPPAEIMGPLPPGLGFKPDGTPDFGENCIIS